MTRKKVNRRVRWKAVMEVDFPTWPHETEVMISIALTLSKNRGGE